MEQQLVSYTALSLSCRVSQKLKCQSENRVKYWRGLVPLSSELSEARLIVLPNPRHLGMHRFLLEVTREPGVYQSAVKCSHTLWEIMLERGMRILKKVILNSAKPPLLRGVTGATGAPPTVPKNKEVKATQLPEET
ncbi:hypothetical protein WMY93_009272 [Mugilogobius chulae]|uniref:Uncharacterized protein n=1 Tax=Mugilogobius chulae TaxID=88201 RepID=A0AAW0PLP7_9GOBI